MFNLVKKLLNKDLTEDQIVYIKREIDYLETEGNTMLMGAYGRVHGLPWQLERAQKLRNKYHTYLKNT